MDVRATIEEIEKISGDVRRAAVNVRTGSVNRKNITTTTIGVLAVAIENNMFVRETFAQLISDLQQSLGIVEEASERIPLLNNELDEVIKDFLAQKTTLESLHTEIEQLSSIVTTVKKDTDEIVSLALNASIVSSKYAHFSGVFDILSNKLNEMSNFISRNLVEIVGVVDPIVNGVERISDENSSLITSIQALFKHLNDFSEIFKSQKSGIEGSLNENLGIGDEIDNQYSMLSELKSIVAKMDSDSDAAIAGSGNNVQIAEQLTVLSVDVRTIARRKKSVGDEENFMQKITNIQELGRIVWQNATKVNSQSKDQLAFSQNSMDFCDKIVTKVESLDEVARALSESADNSSNISHNILARLLEMKENFGNMVAQNSDGQELMNKFNMDYNEIDNIVDFLKNILKQMNLIGILSRIESAREPDDYRQFMTISDNISGLQNNISDNILKIEESVERTKGIIDSLHEQFNSISRRFENVLSNGLNIENNLENVVNISARSKNSSDAIYEKSDELVKGIKKIRDNLANLMEVVAAPIRGSAKNMENGHRLEDICRMISESAEEKVS